ncbi:hypothetical protein [Labilibaculum sp.]|uniref:hypothetical protein n=1 Tax=Labilibaculum sp. TaxID=2060723 RepID=UPI003566C51A
MRNKSLLKIQCIVLLSCLFLLFASKLSAQTQERWKLSVNNDHKPLEVLMNFANDNKELTYLFDITRDTLNMSFVAEEALDWKEHGVGVFAMPKNHEVLKIKLDDVDMENVQVIFYRMWKAMPGKFKNVTTIFELHEYGVTQNGQEVSNFIIRFKMKRPRRSNTIQL